eukprot:4230538-Pleurochrysis_carterae.AAC.1
MILLAAIATFQKHFAHVPFLGLCLKRTLTSFKCQSHRSCSPASAQILARPARIFANPNRTCAFVISMVPLIPWRTPAVADDSRTSNASLGVQLKLLQVPPDVAAFPELLVPAHGA